MSGCKDDDEIVFKEFDNDPIRQAVLGTWQTRIEYRQMYSDGRPNDTLVNYAMRSYYPDDTYFHQPWAISVLSGDTLYYSFTSEGNWWILASDSSLQHSSLDPLWVSEDEAFYQSRGRLDISTISTGKIYHDLELITYFVENEDTVYIQNYIYEIYTRQN